MHAKSQAAEPLHREKLDGTIIATKVLIIGFGLSVIPLLRELERDSIDYAIISTNGQSIWDRFERHGRLDFDMVSSLHSSVYSFELVKRDTKDRYLTSKEFSTFIKQYLARYRSKVTDDIVTLVENYPGRSVVRTQGGKVFEAKHLVVATAFKRKMNHTLNEFDYVSARGKTVVINGMGDSVNLMISKLIPYNNRIILITNGFLALEKLIFFGDTSYTLDQLEYHNLRRVSYLLYRKTITDGLDCVLMFRKLFEFLSIDHFYVKHPRAIRRFIPKIGLRNFPQSPVPNGIIAIKFWSIKSYQRLFDNDDLKQFIKDGYLLNDIAFLLEQGLVELWPREDATIDRDQCTVRWNGEEIAYDYIVDPDHEVPNLPDILKACDGADRLKYEYVYRNNFMGVVPKDLSNVYFIGFTRPTTGGLNNIIEMQSLFTHKMIADHDFHRDIYDNIERKIEKYNNYYGLLDTKGRGDHLVYYGFYTDDVARLMKIAPRLSECRSIKDFVIHYIFPNAAFKYRQSGPYQVEGVREMVHQIYKDHKGFSAVIHHLLTYSLLQLTAYVALAMAYFRHELSGLVVALLVVLVLLNPVTGFAAAYAYPRNVSLNLFMASALALAIYFKSSMIPVVSLFAVFALIYAFRALGWTRAPFYDLKYKKHIKYVQFFRRYCDAYKQVFAASDR